LDACAVCDLNACAGELPLRERLYLDEHWRVSHGWSSLPGWLCIAPREHVERFAELDPAAAASLGPLLRAASLALERVVRCEKTYVILFAEKPGFHHLHVHVVPRMASFDESQRGPGAFQFLNAPESEWVREAERERLAREIGAAIVLELPA